MDGPDALLSNGLPYVIEFFSVVAIDSAGTMDFDRAEADGSPLTLTPASPIERNKAALPLDLFVIDFD